MEYVMIAILVILGLFLVKKMVKVGLFLLIIGVTAFAFYNLGGEEMIRSWKEEAITSAKEKTKEEVKRKADEVADEAIDSAKETANKIYQDGKSLVAGALTPERK